MTKQIHFPWQYSPFDAGGLVAGEIVSLDGTSTERFYQHDVAEIVGERCRGNQFDGDAAFVIRLADGRYAAWTVSYGDSYGNDFMGGGTVYVADEPRTLAERIGHTDLAK